jgi:hypothetical protein
MTNVTFAIYPRDVYRRHVRVIKTAPASRDAGAGWRTDLLTSPFRLYAGRNENQTVFLLLLFLRLHAFEVGLLVEANLLFPQPFHRESEGIADVHAMCRDLGC